MQQADQDGPQPDPGEQTARLSITFGGRGVLEASLGPDGALLLRSALNQIMRDLYKADTDAGVTPRSAARRRADALVEMARRASAADDDRPAARPLIVVRCDLSELFIRAGWQAGAPAFRYQSDNEDPGTGGYGAAGRGAAGRGAAGHGGDAHDFTGDCGRPVTDDGQPVAPSFFRQLLCDADLCRVIVEPPSTVLDVGRAERTATAHQRRGLLVRDGGCVFPGCDRPPGWCEAHHIDWWEDGGPTDIDNLCLLCSHHHHLVHRGDFHLTRTGDGHLVFTRPDGTTVTQPVAAGVGAHAGVKSDDPSGQPR